jgi:hypothetical protein
MQTNHLLAGRVTLTGGKQHRRGFNIRTYARANELSDPVGINFFRAGYGATCKATTGTGVFLVAAPIVYTVRVVPIIIRFIPTAIRWIPTIVNCSPVFAWIS